MKCRFGDCDFDTDSRQLFRGGQPVPLTPKAYQLLELLVRERPRAVSKGQIFEQLWPETFVSEANLASLAFEVRTAIGDDARRSRFLRTVRGFGYAFSAPVEETSPDTATSGTVRAPRTAEASCRLVWGNREVALREGENVLGRTREAAVWIESSTVSRCHARIVVSEGRATLEDLGSKNGTRVNGTPVASAALANGDEIRLGSVAMTYRVFGAAQSTETGVDTPSREG